MDRRRSTVLDGGPRRPGFGGVAGRRSGRDDSRARAGLVALPFRLPGTARGDHAERLDAPRVQAGYGFRTDGLWNGRCGPRWVPSRPISAQARFGRAGTRPISARVFPVRIRSSKTSASRSPMSSFSGLDQESFRGSEQAPFTISRSSASRLRCTSAVLILIARRAALSSGSSAPMRAARSLCASSSAAWCSGVFSWARQSRAASRVRRA